MKISGIYKITNTVNQNLYIGLSKNIKKRFIWHKSFLRKGTHDNIHLQRAWNLYGESAFLFEIIEECPVEQLGEREKYWVDYYGGYKSPMLYNMKSGGEVGVELSEETIERIRQSNLGHKSVWKGKKLPPEMIKKMSESQKGKKLTPEHREKVILILQKYWADKPGYWTGKTITEEHRQHLSQAHKGQKAWNKGQHGMINEETRQKLSRAHKGFHHSEESRKKISEGHKGRIVSEETRQKLSIANKGQRRLWVHKDGVSTTVPPEKLEEFLSSGWERGKGEAKRIWINNGFENKMILESEYDKFDKNIWIKGRFFYEK